MSVNEQTQEDVNPLEFKVKSLEDYVTELEQENVKLSEENSKLKEENISLHQRVNYMDTLIEEFEENIQQEMAEENNE